MTSRPTVLPYGDRALLLETGSTDEAVALAAGIRTGDLADLVDLVPGARTVLAVARPGTDLARLREDLVTLASDAEEGSLAEGEPVRITVVYDGPDLEDVARHTGLSTSEVIEAHTGTPWRVGFAGFAPGFAYLVDGDARLEVPRREESRTQVPKGSVGLAGEFSGVYPTESPGGWQLIGRTEAVLWDLDRDPPALLMPGTPVQFVREGDA